MQARLISFSMHLDFRYCFLHICLLWTCVWPKSGLSLGKIRSQSKQIIEGPPFLERRPWCPTLFGEWGASEEAQVKRLLGNSYLTWSSRQEVVLWGWWRDSVGGWSLCVCYATKGRNYDILRRKVHVKIFLFSFYFKINWTRIHCTFTSQEATQGSALGSPPAWELSAVLKHSLSCSHMMEKSPSVALDHGLFTFEKSSWVPLHDTICRLWHTPYMLKNNL